MITGDRNWNPSQLADRVVTSLHKKYGDGLTLVIGDCKGIDATFAEACIQYGVNFERFEADWSNVTRPGAVVRKRKDGTLYDAAAGPERNRKMIASGVDLCLAFHPHLSISKGTKDAVNQCLKAGIPTWWCWDESEPPVQQRLPKPVETMVADLFEDRS